MTKRKDKVQDDHGFDEENTAGFNTGPLNEGTTAEEEQSGEHVYVKVADVKMGDTLVVTGDEYDCIHDGEEKEVKQDWNGRLFVDCDEGQHFLDKGTDIHDYVIGLMLKPAAKETDKAV